MFVNFGVKEAAASLAMIKQLRASGISAELYPESAKMKKQMGYADSLGVKYVAIIGESELAEGKVVLKDMTEGTQELLTPEQLIAALA
jgi:histidyl-tRNA synthetase